MIKSKKVHRQTFVSKRWLEFVNSIAGALQLGIWLHSADQQFIQLPLICPDCDEPFDTRRLMDQKEIMAELSKTKMLRLELEDGSPVMYSAIDEMLIVVQQCSCNGTSNQDQFYERAAAACELLSSFHHSLQDGIKAGHQAVELSMLRQMNRITLSLFQGDDNAVDKAFDLVLSAAIILLDADASQLYIVIDGHLKRYTRGDESLALLTEAQVPRVAVDLCKGKACGQIAVINPADYEEAHLLMPLLAQECSILMEIDNLFKLMQRQMNQWLGAIGSSLLMLDRHQYIIYLNQAAEKLFNKPASDLLGRSISQAPGPWVASIISQTQIPITEQMEKISIGNEMRWVDWQVSPLLENHVPVGWILLINDRSDVHRWQEASRKAERFGTTAALVGSLAHELRNPLSAATGLLQILSKKRDPAKVAGYTDLILRELDRISRLLNEFLLLGRPANISLEPVDLKQLVNDLLPLLEGEASRSGHEIVIMDSHPVSPI